MITYHYQCEVCQHEFEQAQSIKDKPLKKCPACSQWKLFRVIHGGLDPICNNITTVGQLASHNFKKMGTYEKQERKKEYEDSQKEAKKELRREAERKLGRKLSDVEAKPEVVAKNNKINKMTPEQKKRYIETGKGL